MTEDLKHNADFLFDGIGRLSCEGRAVTMYGVYAVILGLILYFSGAGSKSLFLCYLGLAFSLFSLYFFRDPIRNAQFKPDEIACPADGKVLSVKSEGDPNVTVVRIFLSVFNVHIQRSTMSGTVGEITYNKGTFVVANHPDADKNERNLIRISDGGRFAHVEQITGAIARRIVGWVKPGQQVKIGDKIGLIYFGSQVAVYLPSSVRVLVQPGQKVQGGLTVLGLWK